MYITQIGQGRVAQSGESFHLTVPPVSRDAYHNAQISSYLTPRYFYHRPPLRMSVRAYGEGEIHGTAGFGFWNHPYVPAERRFRLLKQIRLLKQFRLPKACWFFYGSPPNNLQLAKGVPSYGWKAATFDATGWRLFALLPAAPLGFLLMRIPSLYNRLWPVGQRAIGVSEHLLDSSLLQESHEYEIEWRVEGVTFAVDGQTVHESQLSPRGPLGFIAWVDNQYAIVTPQGRFGFGLVDVPQPQMLVLESLQIEGD